MAGIFTELKRRKVFQVGVVYVVVGWVLIQVADASFEHLNLPDWTPTLVIGLIILGFPLAIILAWALEVTPEGIRRTTSTTEPEVAITAANTGASIAVLPFANISGDPENEYFSDGLSEELLTVLSRLPKLRVCSRTSSFALKGKDMDVRAIANALSVRHVLEGSVRRAGERVRITAQLIDAVADSHVWSETYDREIEDIFAVQDEIAGDIARALKLTLSPDDEAAIRKSSTSNVEAYDYYLRGREFYHRGDRGHLAIARDMFEQAIDKDPNYALAYAGLAICLADQFQYHGRDPSHLDDADAASHKAIELDTQLAEAYSARGLVLWFSERYEDAERAFDKSLKLNPIVFETLHFYARMSIVQEKKHKAVDLLERAAKVRPEDFQSRSQLAQLYEQTEREEQSTSMFAEAMQVAKQHLLINPDDVRALYLGSHLLFRLGDSKQAIAWMDKALELEPDQNGVLYNAGCLHSLMGETDKAIGYLEKGVRAGMTWKGWYENDSDLDNLRDHPRFKKLMASL